MPPKPDCRDRDTYFRAIFHLQDIFHAENNELQRIREFARRVGDGIENLSPFIQQVTSSACPRCTDICCISKHGYYNYEDLAYIFALGLKPPPYEFGRRDSAPCQFLTENGCSLKRSMRPSGCNWYFCDNLFEQMEQRPDYRAFDDSLREVALLWTELTEAFSALPSLQEH